MPWEKFLEYFTDISVCQLLMPLEMGVEAKRRAYSSKKASRRSNATSLEGDFITKKFITGNLKNNKKNGKKNK